MTGDFLTVRVRDLPGPVTVIAAVGEIDHGSQILLREAALQTFERGRHRLVLDLAGVSFCDSGGLGLFVDLHRQTAASGGWLRLAAVQPGVRQVLRITVLDRLLPIHPTVESALAEAARMSAGVAEDGA